MLKKSRAKRVRTISMLELRKNAEAIVRRVRCGERAVLTYRGKPVIRLEPIDAAGGREDDPFYRLADLADADAQGLTNQEIDHAIYDD